MDENHKLKRRKKMYRKTSTKYEWMLEQLPIDLWLELNDKFHHEHIHVAAFITQEINNWKDTTFEFARGDEE
jgi:hypothetical protein